MSRRRGAPGRREQGRWLALATTLALAGATVVTTMVASTVGGAAAPLPRIGFSTSLPLSGAEGLSIGQIVQGAGESNPVRVALATLGQLEPVDSAEQLATLRPDLVLLVHPPAWSPRDMVAFDAWVRDGGRAIILADALSSWPAAYPLGDRRNAPVTSLLTPLLTHWGLDLAAPPPGAAAPVRVRDGARPLILMTRGTWRASAAKDARCALSGEGAVARCRIGRGQVTLVADADWLHPSLAGMDGDVADDVPTIPASARTWLMTERDTLLR